MLLTLVFGYNHCRRWLSTEAEVKPYCRNESVSLNVRRSAGHVVTVGPKIEVDGFALYRNDRRQTKLGTPTHRPAGPTFGFALGGASSQRHDRGLRIGATHEVSSILRDHRSALHIHQEPVPICVPDPRGRRGQPIQVHFAVKEETVRTRPSAVGIGPAGVAFNAEHPFPELIVIPDLSAAKKPGI